MRASSFALAVLCLAACRGEPQAPRRAALDGVMDLFQSSLEQMLAYKQPVELYVHKYGRFSLESSSTLQVRRGDRVRDFNGFSRLEMDKRGSFKLARKAFFQDEPVEVVVVGSEALFRDRGKSEYKRMTVDPEFVQWARASVAEIFSAYEQTDFADNSTEAAGAQKCRQSPSGNLCLDPASSLPVSGTYKVDVSGDKNAASSTTMTLEFKILPHSNASELLVFPER